MCVVLAVVIFVKAECLLGSEQVLAIAAQQFPFRRDDVVRSGMPRRSQDLRFRGPGTLVNSNGISWVEMWKRPPGMNRLAMLAYLVTRADMGIWQRCSQPPPLKYLGRCWTGFLWSGP
uniref:Uncharacterized protein n=1 Tax=Ixodes ricinus TaxID=34613 RepID=A0A6B0UMY7_IXORI